MGVKMVLTREIAETIVKETSIRINRNVNIMDTAGRIIASMDKVRINTFHEGALHVVRTGESILIHRVKDKNWEGVQPGINLPIMFKDEVIGVIGVTGDPKEMGNIGELVKMTTELMINQEFIASQFEWKQRMKEMVIEQLLRESPHTGEIKRGVSLLELDFKPPYIGIIIEFDKQIFQRQDVIRYIEQSIGEEKAIAGFISLHQLHVAVCRVDERILYTKIKELDGLIQKLKLRARISYSLPFSHINEFHQSYLDCSLALKVSDKNIVSFANIEVEGLIHQIDEKLTTRFAKRVLKKLDETKLANLQVFFDKDLNIQKAAEALFVH